MDDFITTFIFFFAVIDPIGTIPVFIAATSTCKEQDKTRIAIKAAIVSTVVLIFFMVGGEIILNAMNIPLSAFQVGGGIVLFLFALTMIFGESKPEEEVKMVGQANEKAIYPLAIPSIASPGAMLAAVLLTENDKYNIWEQVQTGIAMISVLVIVLVFMLLSKRIYRLIGNSGASIISRVMGLILVSAAVSSVLEGIKIYFGL